MTKEQEAFIRILKDSIHGVASDWMNELLQEPATIDMDQLAELASGQSLAGFLYPQLKKSVPMTRIPEQFRIGFDSDIYFAVNREVELSEVRNAIPKDVPIILMKGILSSKYYPCKYLRSMGDIDFVIHPEHCDLCDEAMLRLGYDKFVNNHSVWNYFKEDIEFEIHNQMFYEKLTNDVDYVGYFDGVWEHIQKSDEYENILIPTPEYHLLYMITHLAKHILDNGHGFRGYLDFVFMCMQEEKNIDWVWVKEELQKLKLYEFTLTVFAFCERWFDIKMPLNPGKLDDEFFMSVTGKTFKDGTFGLENEDNQIGHTSKIIARSGKSYWLDAMRIIVEVLFPSYSNLRLAPWYKFVDGRPWLVPVAWIYRWLYVLLHNSKAGIAKLLMPVMNRKEIEKREKTINDWRL